jgi:flagellin
MRINHNIAALNTHRQLNSASTAQGKSMEKLASGLRINKAGDDAAGLAISEKMRGQIRGLDMASKNAQDGISLISTAEGALNETHDILQRMRELAVQSSNDTNTSDDRKKIQSEVDQLSKEITRISNNTEFNTQNLMAGGLNNTFHIGSNAGQNISLSINAMDAHSLGIAGSTTKLGSSFTHNGTNISGVTDTGRNLDAGTDYNIDVVKTAAAQGVAIAKTAGTGTAAATGSVDYTGFTGTQNTAYTVKVATVSGDVADNSITAISYSKDGGNTWATATVNSGDATFDGLVWTVGTEASGNKFAVGDEYSFTANAAKATLQLQKGSTDIGSAVTVYYGSTNATLGDAASDKTVKASFDFSTLASASSSNFTITSDSSTAAVISNGVVTNAADAKAGINVSTQSTANAAITKINDAITKVSEERSKLGATQNRLEHTINNLNTSSENLTAAESRIRDVDMAKEMMNQTKNSILAQAAQAMLAQANQQPQGVLQLLR